MAPNIFLLDVDYKGPYDGTCESPEANKALGEAMKDLNDLLKRCGIEEKHEYCWPDGSLYRKIRTPLSDEEIINLLMKNNNSANLRRFDLIAQDNW